MILCWRTQPHRLLIRAFLLAALGFLLFSHAARATLPCTNCPPPCTNCPPFTNPPPPYSAVGLKLTIPFFTNNYIGTTIFEHDAGRAYDIYARTNINTNWVIVAGAFAGTTNYLITNTYPSRVFLMTATGLDSDGDGMPDGWELLHGLNPYSAADAGQDADGDGLTNLQEFLRGTDPKSAEAWSVSIQAPRNFLSLP